MALFNTEGTKSGRLAATIERFNTFPSPGPWLVKLLCGYAGLEQGSQHRVIGEGYDWYRIRHRGKAIYIPSDLCGAA